MKNQDFKRIVQNRLKVCQDLLIAKGEEYNPNVNNGGDRFHSFKRMGLRRGKSSIEALDDVAVKHWISYDDEMAKMAADLSYVPSKEWVNEKITDMINYLVIQEGQIEERRKAIEDKDKI